MLAFTGTGGRLPIGMLARNLRNPRALGSPAEATVSLGSDYLMSWISLRDWRINARSCRRSSIASRV
jgi:hypothetical protein